MPDLDADWRLRLAAFERLRQLRERNGSNEATAAQLAEGFEFEGERIRLSPTQQGIWKPRQAIAALTIVTAPPRAGRPAQLAAASQPAPTGPYTRAIPSSDRYPNVSS